MAQRLKSIIPGVIPSQIGPRIFCCSKHIRNDEENASRRVASRRVASLLVGSSRVVSDRSDGLRHAGGMPREDEVGFHGSVIGGDADAAAERSILVEALVFVVGRGRLGIAAVNVPEVCKRE